MVLAAEISLRAFAFLIAPLLLNSKMIHSLPLEGPNTSQCQAVDGPRPSLKLPSKLDAGTM